MGWSTNDVQFKLNCWYDITPCQITVALLQALKKSFIDMLSVKQIRFILAKIFIARKKAALV